jgi:hypothetical protein
MPSHLIMVVQEVLPRQVGKSRVCNRGLNLHKHIRYGIAPGLT